MKSINSKNKNTKFNKSIIMFIMGAILFITSILTKIHSTTMILKENKNNETKTISNNYSKQMLKKEIGNHTEKISYILGISDTLGETIKYIRTNYKDDTNMQVRVLLKESIAGLNSISVALETKHIDLDNKNIKLETNNLTFLLTKLMDLLDENNIEMVETIINVKLINEYDYWKSDIEKEFN